MQARTPEARIEIGPNTAFSNNVSLVSQERITIGADCLIGDFVLIMDSDFHGVEPDRRRSSTGETRPVSIGSNVWLGSRVVVLKGVTIGDNAVVTPLSVVRRDIPPNCVAGGNPAVVLKSIGRADERTRVE